MSTSMHVVSASITNYEWMMVHLVVDETVLVSQNSGVEASGRAESLILVERPSEHDCSE